MIMLTLQVFYIPLFNAGNHLVDSIIQMNYLNIVSCNLDENLVSRSYGFIIVHRAPYVKLMRSHPMESLSKQLSSNEANRINTDPCPTLPLERQMKLCDAAWPSKWQ